MATIDQVKVLQAQAQELFESNFVALNKAKESLTNVPYPTPSSKEQAQANIEYITAKQAEFTQVQNQIAASGYTEKLAEFKTAVDALPAGSAKNNFTDIFNQQQQVGTGSLKDLTASATQAASGLASQVQGALSKLPSIASSIQGNIPNLTTALPGIPAGATQPFNGSIPGSLPGNLPIPNPGQIINSIPGSKTISEAIAAGSDALKNGVGKIGSFVPGTGIPGIPGAPKFPGADALAGSNADAVTAKANRPNPLHAYPSYTYGLSLHLLTIEDYNNIVERKEYSAKNVLIASAGRHNNIQSGPGAFVRNPHFNVDFYFDSLRMTSVIGLGTSNRATNVLDVSFKLIEPYGMTFMDRLLHASADLGLGNYLENAYLLQIEFYGSDEQGNIVHPIPNITKRIPIKILNVTNKVNAQGSEWAVSAMAFNHQAFTETIVSTPINVEIKADKIREFFEATMHDANQLSQRLIQDRTNSERSDINKDGTKQLADGIPVPINSALVTKAKQVYKAASYADALNDYIVSQEQSFKIGSGDRYDFRFFPEIGDTSLWEYTQRNSPSNTQMADVQNTPQVRKGNAGAASAALDYNRKILSIGYGASIESVIDLLCRNSQYILKQLAISEGQQNDSAYAAKVRENQNKPLNWYKIVPTVFLDKYDFFTNRFAKRIIYNIVPYKTFNTRLAEAPQGKATREDCVKFYNYIYTGQNNDILDLNIEFNAMYYTAKTSYKSNQMYTSGVDTYYDTGTECAISAPPATHVINPVRTVVKSADQTQSSGGGKTSAETTAADISASLQSQSVADMLNVHLTIIGDPEFIKQDDLFYSPTYTPDGWVSLEDRVVTDNGSIITDRGDVFVYLTFQTPTDIDDATGMMGYDQKYNAVGFTGIYKVIKVTNEFEGGVFTQQLDLIRYPNQDKEVIAVQPLNGLGDRIDVAGQVLNTTPGALPVDTLSSINAQLNKSIGQISQVVGKPAGLPAFPIAQIDQGLKAVRDGGNNLNIFSKLPSAPTDNSLNAAKSLLGGG